MIDLLPEQIGTNQTEELIFFDPFADDTESLMMTAQDCERLFETVLGMYEEEKVKFSNAAEKFLHRAKALETDATHLGYIEQASWIEAMMHFMCGEDHGLNQARLNSGLFNDHIHIDGEEHNAKKDDKDKKSKVRKTQERVKKTAVSLWSIIFDNMSSKKVMKGKI